MLLAEIISQRDDATAALMEPIYNRLERELETMPHDDVRERARKRLAAYTLGGASNATA